MAAPPTTFRGRLADKVAVVTGSSSGIGRAIALAYIQAGAKVVCADVTPNARPEIENEANITTLDLLRQQENGKDRVISVQADASKSSDVERTVQEAVKAFGRLDIMVNNAGVAPPPSVIHETSEESWDQVMSINPRSVFLGTKYAITQMLAQDPHPSGDRGWIINIASIVSLVGCAATPTYTASKGAIASLTKQVAVDYAKHRIHCNALCPGYTHTAVLAKFFESAGDQSEALASMHPLRGIGQVDDFTGPAVFLASNDAQWITGISLTVDGGYSSQ